MVERVTNNSNNANQPRNPAMVQPDNSSVNQAASTFESLLESDNKSPRQPTESSSSQENRSTGERVEERPQDGQKSKDEGGGDGQKKDDAPSREGLSPGEAILQSLTKGQVQVGKAEMPAQASSQNLDGVVQQVADQILVAEASNGREVRIFLKDSVLPGTEVRITQNAGKMQVQFLTTSAQSQDVLLQNHASLQQSLNEKISKHDFAVTVEMDTQGQEQQQDGRSRGLIEPEEEKDDDH